MAYAGFWVRFFAGLLDAVFLFVPFLILSFLLGTKNYQSVFFTSDNLRYSFFSASSSNQLLELIKYGLNIAYIGYFLSSKKQATIGKSLMGIYVGNCDGSGLNLKKSIMRALASILTCATFGIGFLLVIFTKEKTALHDIICKTRVFYGKKNG